MTEKELILAGMKMYQLSEKLDAEILSTPIDESPPEEKKKLAARAWEEFLLVMGLLKKKYMDDGLNNDAAFKKATNNVMRMLEN